MYEILLTLHSWLRWVVLLLALLAIVNALLGSINRRPFTKGDERNGLLFMISCDVQLLIGLILYFVSPLGMAAFGAGNAMKDAAVRYFAVEHLVVMLIAIVLVHIGRSRSKTLQADAARHRAALLFYGIALLLMLSRIPFSDRPLMRF